MKDVELDRLLTEASQATDPDTRLALYASAQKKITEQVLIIPIRDYVNLNMASAKVTGLQFSAEGWFPWLSQVDLQR